jgi:Tfp pilus assembly protein PilX
MGESSRRQIEPIMNRRSITERVYFALINDAVADDKSRDTSDLNRCVFPLAGCATRAIGEAFMLHSMVKGKDFLPHGFPPRLHRDNESGVAVLLTLIVLSVITLLGMYMAFSSSTENRISDNYESRIRADYAAQAGLNHARELFRGLELDDMLNGPSGPQSRTSQYLATARTFAFRNPLTWNLARSLNLANPTNDVTGLPTDGLISTGAVNTTSGTILIPLSGLPFSDTYPVAAAGIVTARYLVKVTDNNGEASELAGDSQNNPFVDGDHIVIVRALGVAGTLREDSGGTVRRNAVAVYETRLKRRMTFDLDAPFVVEGNQVQPCSSQMFAGNAFGIYGDTTHVGVATIDTNTGDGILPSQQISSQVASNQRNNITGMGLTPSISDITNAVAADPDKALLQNSNYLWNFVHSVVPQAADLSYNTSQSWHGGSAPDIGSIDLTLPANDPSQHPKIVYVNGDLDISGNITGGGVLVVTGRLKGSGSLTYNGLILVIGTGEVDGAGLNIGFNGGMFVANVTSNGVTASFGTPKFSWKGNSNIRISSKAIRMGMNMFPMAQLGWREVTSIIDPN